MWLFLNDSFLSIVAHGDKPDTLLVRGRKPGDIEALFPAATVREGEGTDYRYRADVPVKEVAQAVAARVKGIGYSNFKGSVRDRARHDAYLDVWKVMRGWGDKEL